jgi:hypothetical protein
MKLHSKSFVSNFWGAVQRGKPLYFVIYVPVATDKYLSINDVKILG